MKTFLTTLLACAAIALQSPATAHTVDTGTPNGQAIGALTLDANDAYAGQVSFATSAVIDAAFVHLLGGAAGETFTIALYDDTATHVPGAVRYATTATYGADGFNGVSGLRGWTVGPGLYWIAFEVAFGDTLGSTSVTGALLDVGAPNPLVRTAFDAGGGYVATTRPLGFGVQLDARAIPEPSTVALLFLGLALVTAFVRRRIG